MDQWVDLVDALWLSGSATLVDSQPLPHLLLEKRPHVPGLPGRCSWRQGFWASSATLLPCRALQKGNRSIPC